MDKAIEPSVSGQNAVSAQDPATSQAISEMLAHAQGHMLRQINRMNGHCVDLFDRLHALQRMDLSFGRQLVNCQSPAEAVAICGEWAIKRFDALGAAQCRVLEMCHGMIPDSTQPTPKDIAQQ